MQKRGNIYICIYIKKAHYELRTPTSTYVLLALRVQASQLCFTKLRGHACGGLKQSDGRAVFCTPPPSFFFFAVFASLRCKTAHRVGIVLLLLLAVLEKLCRYEVGVPKASRNETWATYAAWSTYPPPSDPRLSLPTKMYYNNCPHAAGINSEGRT